MGCCGATAGRIVVNRADIEDGLRFEVEYWGGRTLEVIGAVTSTKYEFSGLSRRALIDPRDAPALLRNQFFRLKGTKKIQLHSEEGN